MTFRSLAKVLLVIALVFEAGSAHAATLEVSGWLPYWRKATSTADALQHLNQLTEINPFGYSVKSDGTLADTMDVTKEPWLSLFDAARKQKVRIIPTIMWSDGEAIHRILSNQKTRIALEDAIVAEINARGFDGVDIDFENKYAETRDYYSTFLKGLYQRMGKKWVMCAVESRTPLSSRYDGTPPAGAGQYANDYAAIAKYCDRVRIMAYDQGAIDVKLNAAANNTPYVPVADVKWVEKTLQEALKFIPKSKLSIGVATYGYEYQVTPLAEHGFRYDRLWALNPKYAFDLMAQNATSVTRNSAGELSFSYIPKVVETPDPTAMQPAFGQNMAVSFGAVNPSAVNTTTSVIVGTSFNVVWWSDGKAIKDKIDLAKKYGIRGIAIFKIDGGEDQALWDYLPKLR